MSSDRKQKNRRNTRKDTDSRGGEDCRVKSDSAYDSLMFIDHMTNKHMLPFQGVGKQDESLTFKNKDAV